MHANTSKDTLHVHISLPCDTDCLCMPATSFLPNSYTSKQQATVSKRTPDVNSILFTSGTSGLLSAPEVNSILFTSGTVYLYSCLVEMKLLAFISSLYHTGVKCVYEGCLSMYLHAWDPDPSPSSPSRTYA